MMPLRLFRNRHFAGVNGLTLLYYAGLSAALFVLPFVLIEVHGYTAGAAGAAFLPLSILMAVGSRWTGRLVEHAGSRMPLILGSAITACGYVVLALSENLSGYWTAFLPGLVIVGIGVTLCVAPLTTTVFASSPQAQSGTASGVNNA